MSNLGLMIFMAILPIVLILVLIYNKDKEKEPISLLIQLFCLGILSGLVVAVISHYASYYIPFMQDIDNEKSFADKFLYSFIGIALLEETVKWIALYIRGYNSENFDELFDIIVYSVFVSLGFAFFENMIFIINGNGDLTSIILRSVSAVPGHACDAIFMGYYLALAKKFQFDNKKQFEKYNIILSILIPTILHGVYDFCLMSGLIIFVLVFVIFIIFLYILSIKKIEESYINNVKLKKEIFYCQKCGSKNDSEFCTVCGHKIKK